MAKMLQFNEEALASLLKGIKTLSKAVITTLGPKGRNVVIHNKNRAPISTKDGVTVAKEIVLKDKFENMGAQLLKEASSKTADIAGDGTTTAIVLADAIFSQGVKNALSGTNPMSLKRGIDQAVTLICQELDKMAKKVESHEEILQTATISANNDREIGEIIANAMKKVGKDGIVTISDSKGIETTFDAVEGMRFDKGYLSPYFVNNGEKMHALLENCRILIVDKKISSAKEFVPILEKALTSNSSPLLIIAEDVDSDALTTLVINRVKANAPLCAVKAPAFGEKRKAMLEDIATLTGATVISEEIGHKLETAGLEVLGFCKKAIITKDDTTLVEGKANPERLQKRIAQVRSELAKTESSYEKEKLEARLASLAGGVGVIYVGAATEAELNEKKARVEDALHATRAAISEGIVPGGGVALLRAMKCLERLKLSIDEMLGVDIIRHACYAPIIAIADNCGKQGNLIAEKVLELAGSMGYNGLTDQITDLLKDGVIDPVLVTKTSLRNAASISGLLITVAAMITDKPQPKSKQAPMGGMNGMGGMGGMGGYDDMDY